MALAVKDNITSKGAKVVLSGSAPTPSPALAQKVTAVPLTLSPSSSEIVRKPIDATPAPPPPKPVQSIPVAPLPKPVVVVETAPPPPKVETFVPKPVVQIERAPVNVAPEVTKIATTQTQEPVLGFIKDKVSQLNNYVVEQSIDRVADKAKKQGADAAKVDAAVSQLNTFRKTDASFLKKVNQINNIGTAAVTTAIVGLAAVGAGAAGVGAGVGGGGAAGGAAVAGGGGAGVAGALGAVGSAAAAISKLGGSDVSPGQQTEPESFAEKNAAYPGKEDSIGGGGLGLAAAIGGLLFLLK